MLNNYYQPLIPVAEVEATHCRCGEKYDINLMANLLLTVENFQKSVDICQSYERISSGTILWTTVQMLLTETCKPNPGILQLKHKQLNTIQLNELAARDARFQNMLDDNTTATRNSVIELPRVYSFDS